MAEEVDEVNLKSNIIVSNIVDPQIYKKRKIYKFWKNPHTIIFIIRGDIQPSKIQRDILYCVVTLFHDFEFLFLMLEKKIIIITDKIWVDVKRVVLNFAVM